MYFNINISCTLLELIANYDTSLLVSNVCANCAVSNDARVTVFISFLKTIALFCNYICITVSEIGEIWFFLLRDQQESLNNWINKVTITEFPIYQSNLRLP